MLPFDLSPRQEDRAIAVCGLLGGLVLIAFGAYDRSDHLPGWLVALPLLATAVLELFRRTHPVWTASLGGLVFIGTVLAARWSPRC
ncbi:hypothetical protein ACFQ0T_14535 [Kitasatospora gansuensis]